MYDPYDSLVPIFRLNDRRDGVEPHASAVLIKIHKDFYLFSAAHAFVACQPGDLFVPAKDGLTPLRGDLRFIRSSEKVEDDLTDVAVLGIPGALRAQLRGAFSPFPQTRTALVTSALDLGGCSISGFPVSKAKKRENMLSSEVFSFRGIAAERPVYERHSIDPTRNLVIHFDRSRAVYPGTLEPFPAPGLRGLSGGAIFAWPDEHVLSTDWSIPKLVAIFHSYRESTGLAIGTLLMPYVGLTQIMEMQRDKR